MRKGRAALAAICMLLAGLLAAACGQTGGTDTKTAVSPAGSAAEFGLFLQEEEDGLYVVAVRDKSPASTAGIVAGDLIVAMGESEVRTHEALESILSGAQETLPVQLVRAGEQMTIVVNFTGDSP